MVQELKDKKIELMFDKWKFSKNDCCKIFLSDFTNPELKVFKDTKYYIFDGCFTTENYHNIIPLKPVVFWFTKRSFDNAIVKVVNFKELDATKEYGLKCSITRLNKLDLMIQDLTIQD